MIHPHPTSLPLRRWRHLVVVTGIAVLLAGLVASLGTGRAGAGSSSRQLGDGGRVLVVSIPRLTWAMVEQEQPPALSAFAERAALASMSVRTIGPVTTLGEAYLTIGAGNRATLNPLDEGVAFAPGEEAGGATAAAIFERRTGVAPGDAAVLQLAIGAIERRNDQLLYEAEPGSLGQALRDAGRSAAVVGSADVVGADGRTLLQRSAALAVMDADGRVDGGTVTGLLQPVATAAGGLRLDVAATVAATREALDDHDVVVVELSDLDRVDADRTVITPASYGDRRAEAIAASDEALAEVLELVDPTRDLVVVTSPAAPRGSEGLTTFAIAGPGAEGGLARSATTRRAGYVTLPDVAPTILHALDVEIPDAITGTRITATSGTTTPAGLADADTEARFRNQIVGPVSVTYIVGQVLVYGAAVAALRGRRWLAGPVEVAALAVLAVPLVGFASGAVRVDGLGVPGYVVAVLAAATAVGWATWPLRRVHLLLPPLVLVGTNLVVQLADVATGGRLQLDTPFGYSPIVAGRFAGFGNLAFSLVAIAAIVVATTLWGLPRRSTAPRRDRWLVGAVVVLVVTLAVDGAPSMGSDVGGVLAAAPAFALTVALLGGWRVSWRKAVVVMVATVATVAALALVDLSRPDDQRTHLGRFAQRLADGDGGVILQRKLEANLAILTSSVWAYVIPVALAFLAFLATRRTGFMGRLFEQVPGAQAVVVGGLTAGVLGFALNDSGVAIPAMMFGILLPHLTYLVLRIEAGEAGAAESGEHRPERSAGPARAAESGEHRPERSAGPMRPVADR